MFIDMFPDLVAFAFYKSVTYNKLGFKRTIAHLSHNDDPNDHDPIDYSGYDQENLKHSSSLLNEPAGNCHRRKKATSLYLDFLLCPAGGWATIPNSGKCAVRAAYMIGREEGHIGLLSLNT